MSSAQIYRPEEEKKKPTTMQMWLIIGLCIAAWVAWKYYSYKFYSANPRMAALAAAF